MPDTSEKFDGVQLVENSHRRFVVDGRTLQVRRRFSAHISRERKLTSILLTYNAPGNLCSHRYCNDATSKRTSREAIAIAFDDIRRLIAAEVARRYAGVA